jgi:hypothetical protein
MDRLHLISPQAFPRLCADVSIVVGKSHLKDKVALNSIEFIGGRGGAVHYIAADYADAIAALPVIKPKYIFCSGMKVGEIRALMAKSASIPIILINCTNKTQSYYEEYMLWATRLYSSEDRFGYAFNIMPEDSTGMKRLNAIKELMTLDYWRIAQRHYLFGLKNPAEPVLYKKSIHSLRARNSISGFVSDRCFIDSAIGINYQFWRIDNTPFKALDQDYLNVEYKNEIQYANFVLNDMTMKGFCDGALGLHFWESVTGESL